MMSPKTKQPHNLLLYSCHLRVLVVSLGFEPRQADPETAVLPLHHETILLLRVQK